MEEFDWSSCEDSHVLKDIDSLPSYISDSFTLNNPTFIKFLKKVALVNED